MESELYNLFVIAGLVISLLGSYNLVKALNRRSWPETVGRIQKNETYKKPSLLGFWFNSGLYSLKTGRAIEDSGKRQRLWLSYVYAVEKYKYVGHQLYSAPIVHPKNRIFGLIEGDKVKVFYNPKKPQVAFLAHSFSWPSVVVILVGLGVTAFGVYFRTYA